MIVLVTGGRKYPDRDKVFTTLNDLCKSRGRITGLIHGMASGADAFAAEWMAVRIKREILICAENRKSFPASPPGSGHRPSGRPYHPDLWMVGCPALWDDLETQPVIRKLRADGTPYNAAAGGIRNQYMLTWHPNLVVAFPGGTGTADMCRRARAAGLEPIEIQ